MAPSEAVKGPPWNKATKNRVAASLLIKLGLHLQGVLASEDQPAATLSSLPSHLAAAHPAHRSPPSPRPTSDKPLLYLIQSPHSLTQPAYPLNLSSNDPLFTSSAANPAPALFYLVQSLPSYTARLDPRPTFEKPFLNLVQSPYSLKQPTYPINLSYNNPLFTLSAVHPAIRPIFQQQFSSLSKTYPA